MSKGTYKIVDGNAIDLFFESNENAIFMHGANCQKLMKSGIAGQIAERVSPLYFLDFYDYRSPTQRLGNYSYVVLGQNKGKLKIGVNLYTQFQPGANFDIYAFINSLRAFKHSLPENPLELYTVYMPKIGCGIGGAKWEDVEPVIKKELKEFNVVVVNYKENLLGLAEQQIHAKA